MSVEWVKSTVIMSLLEENARYLVARKHAKCVAHKKITDLPAT